MDFGGSAGTFVVVRRVVGSDPAYEVVGDESEVPGLVEAGLDSGDDVEVFRMENVPFRFVEERRVHPAA